MPPGLISARQLLLVVATDWTSSGAYLSRYERPDATASWVPAGLPLELSLGRAGLAWAPEFVTPGMSPGPIKREGDGCSPAGAFPVTGLFGVAGPMPGAKLPWLQATPDLKCVDDPASRHYNRIVEQSRVGCIDWNSCEDMLRTDGRYEVGAVVGCNVEPAVPGAGSCIFLHVREAPGTPTAGCSALARDDMIALAAWLDGARSPWLVQLPHAAYADLRGPWRLPEIFA
mgnify:CR=1 FL=1